MAPVQATSKAGFTLLEVAVALSLAGMLLLGARWTLQSVAAGAERVAAAATRVDRDANAERLLRDLALRAEVRFSAGPRFRGDPRGVHWSTWCDVPAGWQERCEVTLALVRAGDRNVAALSLADGTLVPLRSGFQRGAIMYLRSAAGGGVWTDRWDSDLEVPLGIGVVVDGDTLVARIGERGQP